MKDQILVMYISYPIFVKEKRFGAENLGIRRNRIRIRGKFGLSSEGGGGQILLLDIPKIPQTFHILSNLSTTSRLPRPRFLLCFARHLAPLCPPPPLSSNSPPPITLNLLWRTCQCCPTSLCRGRWTASMVRKEDCSATWSLWTIRRWITRSMRL